jgi:hypothetical protein
MLRDCVYREVMRLMGGIDLDGVEDAEDIRTVRGVEAAHEAFGRFMHVSADEFKVLRRLYADQEPAYYAG